jgi:hypothetical protein
MNLTDATRVREKNISLIGQTNDLGFTVDDVIVVPIEENKRKEFMNDYLMDRSNINVHYDDNEDFEVWAVDLKNLEESGRIFYSILLD